MSVDPMDFYRTDVSSECCGAAALGEIDDDQIGICADCHEHAVFQTEEEVERGDRPGPDSPEFAEFVAEQERKLEEQEGA